MKKKIIFSLLLAIALSYCLSIFSYAKSISDNQYEVLSMYVNKYSGSFSTSGVTCDMYASINGTPNVTKVNIKLELQKKKDGEYSTVGTWEETYNSTAGKFTKSKAISPWGEYRLKATVTAYVGSKSESITFYRYDK